MAEDSSRRKKNNPSRVLQNTELQTAEEEANQQFNENEIIDIPDDDENSDQHDSKGWFTHTAENVPSEDNGRGFIFSAIEGQEAEDMDVRTDPEADETLQSLDAEPHSRKTPHSILNGNRTMLNRRQGGNSFSRPRQFMGGGYDNDTTYNMESDTSQVRRQQRAVEPFVCRTTSSSGKKDASMQFPDDELAILREENDELRKENAELRKKVDRLVETIALNDALPSLLASLRGEHTESSQSPSGSLGARAPPDDSHTLPHSSTTTPTTTPPTPSSITISKCHSLAVPEEPALVVTSAPSTIAAPMQQQQQGPVIPVSEMGVVAAATQMQSIALTQVAVTDCNALPQIPLSHVSLPQLAAAMDHEMMPHPSQQQVQIPRAPVLPVLAPSIQMGLTGQPPMVPPMVPPGAPSQLAMIQQSLANQIPQSTSQTVLSQMAPSTLAPVRMRDRGKFTVRQAGKQAEHTVEISLSNRVKVDKRLLDRCNHTNFRKLTSDLLMCLFPRKVLSRSTLGGTSNAISRTTGLPTNKTRLDPEKVEAILDYVQRVTGVPARAVKDAIRTKLNNEAKRMHRQLIFKRSMHYPPDSSEGPT